MSQNSKGPRGISHHILIQGAYRFSLEDKRYPIRCAAMRSSTQGWGTVVRIGQTPKGRVDLSLKRELEGGQKCRSCRRFGLDQLRKGEDEGTAAVEENPGQRSCQKDPSKCLECAQFFLGFGAKSVQSWPGGGRGLEFSADDWGVQSQKHGIFGFMKSFSEGEPGSSLRIMKYIYRNPCHICIYLRCSALLES